MERTKSLPQDKQDMLDKLKLSGKSIKQYSVDKNISYHFLSYWHRKQRSLSTGRDKKFIKVKLSDPIPSLGQNKTEIIYSNGNRIVFYGSININELRQLVK
jgi:hypothetical protein